jgi:CBS domain-containing membrane protein
MQAPTPTPRHASPVPPARSWRRYAMRWRARWSIPALLARREESGVVSLAAAVNAIIAILGISLIAWLLDMPVLFPALGPSAFLLFSQPFSTAAAPRQVVVGHAVGMLTGLATWHAMSALASRPLSPTDGGPAEILGAAVALALTSVLLVWLSAPHAPACASALIVALGLANDGWALAGMVLGVALLTAQAVAVNHLAGVHSPTWAPRPQEEARQ